LRGGRNQNGQKGVNGVKKNIPLSRGALADGGDRIGSKTKALL